MKYWLGIWTLFEAYVIFAIAKGIPKTNAGLEDLETGIDGPFERSVDSFGEVEDAHCGYFIKHAGMSLFGFNTKRVENIALAECWRLCVRQSTFYCRSVDFNADSSSNGDSTTCFLSSENSTLQPDALDSNFNTDFYERTCEAPAVEGSAGGGITI